MENILSINLETTTAPIIQEVRGRDYIEYGTEDWKNLYPQFLIDLYYNSSTHAAVINATAEMIAGENLICTDADTNLDAFVKLKKFMRNANSKETLHQVIKKVAFDFKLQGAYAIHVVWNRERTEIAEIYHVPVERVRAGRPNEFGKVDVLVNNAGASSAVRTISHVTEEMWDNVFDLNIKAVYQISQKLIPLMLENKSGTIITISSMAALNPGLLGGAPYGAAKAGVTNLTLS